jgi:hypothetical protein
MSIHITGESPPGIGLFQNYSAPPLLRRPYLGYHLLWIFLSRNNPPPGFPKTIIKGIEEAQLWLQHPLDIPSHTQPPWIFTSKLTHPLDFLLEITCPPPPLDFTSKINSLSGFSVHN